MSQLLEYRFSDGADEDRLCLLVDRPISDRRRAVIESLNIGVLALTQSGELEPVGQLAAEIVHPAPIGKVGQA